MTQVDWRRISLVIFDLDGTLYDQGCLRRKMVRELIGHCLRHPTDFRVLRQISRFRRCREELAEQESDQIAELQFLRAAESLGIHPGQMRDTVQEWMMERPLAHLRSCRYAKVAALMTHLRENGRKLAVLSDYPASEKLRALDLAVDLEVSGVDPEVDRLKPHPRGVERVLELAGVAPDRALLIGDREDRDGESARRAGVAYLIKSREATAGDHQFGSYAELVGSLHSIPAEEAALQ